MRYLICSFGKQTARRRERECHGIHAKEQVIKVLVCAAGRAAMLPCTCFPGFLFSVSHSFATAMKSNAQPDKLIRKPRHLLTVRFKRK